VLLNNTPQWNEAYGNWWSGDGSAGDRWWPYRRAARELVAVGATGCLVPPETTARSWPGRRRQAEQLNRYDCRRWLSSTAPEAFACPGIEAC